MTTFITVLPSSLAVGAVATPPAGEDAVGVTVEIAPLSVTCIASCPVSEEPPVLPVTGSEPLSLLLPIALFAAGVAATVWARRKPAHP
ncbi:hypothetical protein ACFXP7_12455 [Microbacterium sp. P06]|uniref:hypothetical protein n=1 Tax=unclassified Microbacterium TaxID=2609290 RepID=UPI0037471365